MNARSTLDCGSGCRGFDPRHSPRICEETPGRDCPLVPPGAPASTGYSPNTVQRTESGLAESSKTGRSTGAIRRALESAPSLLVAASELGISVASLRRLAKLRPQLTGPYAFCRLRGLSWAARSTNVTHSASLKA